MAMTLKRKLLASFFAIVLILVAAISLAYVYRLTLIPRLCLEWADLDCRIDRFDISLDRHHLVLELGELTVANSEGKNLLGSQQLSLKLTWTELFKQQLMLDQLYWRGLIIDTVIVNRWLDELAVGSNDELGSDSTVEDATRWRYAIRQMELTDWQILLPSNKTPLSIIIDRLTSSIDEQKHRRSIILSGSFHERPIKLAVDMTQPLYAMQEKSLFDVKLNADIAGIIIVSNGEVDLLGQQRDSRFDFNIDARAISEIAALFDLPSPNFHAFNLQGKIQARVGEFYHLNDFSVLVSTDRDSRVNVRGNVKDIFSRISPNLLVDINISSLSRLLATFGTVMENDLSISARGEMLRDGDIIALHDLDVGVSFDNATTQFGDQYTLSDSQLELAITLKDLLSQDDFSLPLLLKGGLLSSNIDLHNEAYGFDINIIELPLTVTDESLLLKLDGQYKSESLKFDLSLGDDWNSLLIELTSSLLKASVKADLSDEVMIFDSRVELRSAERLSTAFELPLPAIETLIVDATLAIGDSINVQQSRLQLVNDSIAMTARTDWDSNKQGHNASLELTAGNFSDLGKFIQQLRLDLEHIADAPVLLAMLATRSTVDVGRVKTIPVIDKERWDEVIKNNPWALSPIAIKSALLFKPDQLEIHSLSIDMAGELVDAHIKADGLFGEAKKTLNASIDTRLKPGAFASLEQPLSIHGTVASEGATISSNDLLIRYQHGVGNLDFILDTRNPEKPDLSAIIAIDDLDLSLFIRQWKKNQSTLSAERDNVIKEVDTEQLKTEVSKGGKVIPDRPLPIKWLQAANLDIDYRINRLNLDRLVVNEWHGEIELKEGVFNWPESKLDLLDGDITFSAKIDSQQATPYWQFTMSLEQLNPARMRSDKQNLLDGPISSRIELNGNGTELRELMASLNGRVTLGMDDVTLHGANLNSLAPNFIKSTLRILNPFADKNKDQEKETFFECSVFHALFTDGVMLADDSILARTTETDVTASWQLNLQTEEQVIQAYPKQRATLSIPTGDLAKAIEITGTLANPEVGVNTTDLVVGSAKTAFFFVGGWIYVMSKNELDKKLEEEGVCQQARDYWLQYSLAEMQQHRLDKQQEKEKKKAENKSKTNRSRRPRR